MFVMHSGKMYMPPSFLLWSIELVVYGATVIHIKILYVKFKLCN